VKQNGQNNVRGTGRHCLVNKRLNDMKKEKKTQQNSGGGQKETERFTRQAPTTNNESKLKKNIVEKPPREGMGKKVQKKKSRIKGKKKARGHETKRGTIGKSFGWERGKKLDTSGVTQATLSKKDTSKKGEKNGE